ncbi:MAG: hypothetical protein ABI193_09680, partial [Minicystis sp.]
MPSPSSLIRERTLTTGGPGGWAGGGVPGVLSRPVLTSRSPCLSFLGGDELEGAAPARRPEETIA